MRKAVLVALIALMSASVLAQSDASEKSKSPIATSASATQGTPNDASYQIGPEDVINIAVWKEPDFSSNAPVRPDGKISIALLGDIQAAGKTPVQLASELTGILKKYIAEPRVTVTVTTINIRRVFLMGEVGRPGPVVITPSMTVLQAIAAAGGPTTFANAKKTYVLRTENGKQTKIPFNYKEAIKGNVPEQNIVLRPGDTIVIP